MDEQDRKLRYASPATRNASKRDPAGLTPVEQIAAFIFFTMIGGLILIVLLHWVPMRWFF
jgi:hypothetical protein